MGVKVMYCALCDRLVEFVLKSVHFLIRLVTTSELNVDNWNDNCEAKSEAKSPRRLRGLQVDFSLTRNVSYAVR